MNRRDALRAATATTGVVALGMPLRAPARMLNGFDLTDTLIPEHLIEAGGPPRDGIPAIDEPLFVEPSRAGLSDTDRVLGLSFGAVARAYPVRILNWHEIVNDRIADQPVAVTYCPLCGSGMAFDARVGGQITRFGVSGLLYNGDVLLYDRRTGSLGSQIMARAVSGPMKWQVLTPVPRLLFDVQHRDDRLPVKAWVVGIVVGGRAKAYPFDWLARNADRNGQWRESLGGQSVVVRYDRAARSAEVFDASGKTLPSVSAFWFAWFAFHPQTEVAGTDRR
jgi:hypothetical protein